MRRGSRSTSAPRTPRPYAPCSPGQAWGRPWGTTWFRLTGDVPADWAAEEGCEPEIVVDLGFGGAQPGFSAEATAYAPDGTIVKGLHPRNRHLPLTGNGPVDALPRGLGQSGPGADDVPAHPAGRPRHRGNRTAVPVRRRVAGRAGHACVWELIQDVDTLTGLMHELPVRLAAPRARSCGPWTPWSTWSTPTTWPARPRRDGPCSPRSCGSRRTRARTGSRPSGTRTSTRPGCGRSARRCASVARTFANVAGADGRATPSFVFACSSAQQYAWIQRPLPRALRADPAAGGRGPLRPGRRHVGRVRHQHARRRGAGPAVRGRASASSSRSSASSAARSGCPTRSATPRRCRRSSRLAGVALVPHPEDLVERDQPDAAPHLLVGGHRRHPAVHPLPAGRHLQLRPVRARAGPRRAPVRREGRRANTLAGAVRLG